MIITEDVYLEHYGVKGMKWGTRKAQAANAAKATGRVAWKGTKAVGRGTKKAALWSKEHPKEASAIAIGTYGAVKFLQSRGRTKLSAVKGSPTRNKGLTFASKRFNKAKSLKMPKNMGKVPKIPDLNTRPTEARKLYRTTFRG